jgi:hypothetical protein
MEFRVHILPKYTIVFNHGIIIKSDFCLHQGCVIKLTQAQKQLHRLGFVKAVIFGRPHKIPQDC